MFTASRADQPDHRICGRLVRRLALPMVPIMVVAGIQQPAFAGTAVRGAPPVPAQRAAALGKPLPTKPRNIPNPAAEAALKEAPKVSWPSGGAADLDLGGKSRLAAVVGGLPVTVGAAPSGDRTGGSAADAASRIRLTVLDRASSTRAGATGPVVTVRRTDGGQEAHVRVEIDYSAFADAFGGDFGARLRFVRLPECVLSTPAKPECQEATLVESTVNDSARRRLSASVEVSADARTVLAAEAGDASSQGDYSATKLSPSSKWDVSLASGAFTWSYPLRTPPTPGGLGPEVGLSYSSQSVDGRTSSTNNQGSWIGEGFTYEPGYVERRYKPCKDDGHDNYGDQCWAFQNGTVMFAGHSGDLVKISDNLWKLSSDDGTRIERLTGATNGDNDGEYWKATTTDGTQYFFGLNRLSGWASGKEETNSTWTSPVFGDDSGEPCYKSTGFSDSYCDQGWRWNLDYVKDPHGNVIAYYYGKEFNYYALAAKTDVNGAKYVRGGYLKRIDYGQIDGEAYTTNAPARVRFDIAERCIPGGTFTCAEDQLNEANANHWPDVPVDRNCAPDTHCKITQASPSFWTRKRLTMVTTEIRGASGWSPVEQWGLKHSFTDNGDGSKTLWVDQINHSGLSGGRIDMPSTDLIGIQMPNRIDTTTDMIAPLNRYRISTVYTDTGAQVQVNYAASDCSAGSLPTPGASTKRCYPVKWDPQGTGIDITDWFHKYVVGQVIQVDRTGGNSDQVTNYEYGTSGFGDQDPISGGAWRKAEPDGITKDKDLTWSVWRGYPKVTVRSGDMQTLKTRVDHFFFRGMDGDETPGGGTRTVKVSDSEGATYTDSDELNGIELESITYNGSEIASKKINKPKLWFTQTQSETWGTRRAAMIKTEAERVLTPLTPDSQGNPVWRETKTVSTYDQTWGRITQAEDLGDVDTDADDQCTKTSYADNAGAWMYKYPKLTEKFSVKCASITDRKTQLLSSERKTYDSQAYGAGPTKGDVTTLETLDSDDGTTTKYLASTVVVNSYGRPTKVTDPAGNSTSTSYVFTNGLNTQTTVTNAAGHVTITDTLPAFGVPVAVTDPNNKKTELAYDALGRLTSVWMPNRSKSLGYTPNTKYSYQVRSDKPTVITTEKIKNDGTYVATYQLLDSLLRVRQTQSQGPDGGWILTDTLYNSTGQVAVSNGNYFATGATGDSVLIVPEGSVNGQTKYLYDGSNRLTDEIFAVAGDERWRTTTTYDGDRTSTDPPQGGVPRSVVKDARGQTTALYEYAGPSPTGSATVTRYSYAKNGKIESMTDAKGNVWSYSYDQRGNLIETGDPDAGTTKFGYDKLNRQTSSEDAQGNVTSTVYDKLDRKTELWRGQPVTGTKLAAWAYDSYYKGQLAGTIRYVAGGAYYITFPQRDNLYKPLKTSYIVPSDAGAELAKTYDFSISYNVDGTVQTIGMPAGGGLAAESLAISYDELQRPLSLTGTSTYVVNDATYKTRYSNVGELLQMTLWNGTGKKAWETFSYERGTGRLTGIRVDREAAPVVDMDAQYRYDDGGNVLSITDTPAGGTPDTQCFDYDGYRRLVEAWSSAVSDPGLCDGGAAATGVGGSAPYHEKWSIDEVGNRTSETIYSTSGGDDTTRTYRYPDPGSSQPHTVRQVDQSVGATTTAYTYTYNARGAVETRGTATQSERMDWDAEGRLATHTVAGKSTNFVYDADGNRLVRKEPNATTLYLGDMELRLDLTTRAVSGTRYYSFAGRKIATRTASNLSYTVADKHGTNACAIDAQSGAISWRRTTPYGAARGGKPATWPDDKGFVGGTVDASGLVHLGAREYDPALGRFISVDPVLDINDPQQINGYSYSNNNPVSLTDPTGTRPWEEDLVGGSGLPPAPPPTCSSATPEYCHKPGRNRHTPVTLFAKWVAVEAIGCPTSDQACYSIEYFREGDFFTEEIRKLVTVEEARKAVEQELAKEDGKLSGSVDWHLADPRFTPEDRKMAALNNALGILTSGKKGMQHALAFIGSYDLKWEVVGTDGNGQPVVEFWLGNSSTKASGKLSKGKVADYGPNNPASGGSGAEPGEHYLEQSVRWRETFVGGKAPAVDSDRKVKRGPLLLMPISPYRRVPWNYPTQKDPLVSDSEYGMLEESIKTGTSFF